MQTDNLFSLELKRNNLRPYQIAAVISNFFILGFIYLMAAIPQIDPGDSDVELFSSYKFVIGLSFVVMMGIFSIISATMASRFIVDEYSGKKAILLLSYPISRKKILKTKILMVFIFSFVAMFIGGMVDFIIFLLTESLVPISTDNISIKLILTNIVCLTGSAINASFCGIVSGWIGLKKQSIITTIVASVIIMVIMCQITAMTFFSGVAMTILVFGMSVLTLLAVKDMLRYIEKIEI